MYPPLTIISLWATLFPFLNRHHNYFEEKSTILFILVYIILCYVIYYAV